jgi:hypothetical protein
MLAENIRGFQIIELPQIGVHIGKGVFPFKGPVVPAFPFGGDRGVI